MTSYNDKNDAVANKDAGGGAETCMSLSLDLLLQLSYISQRKESRVARNTILIQRDVLWTGKI